MQLSESRLYAPHRFADIVVACGIAHAEALRIAESVTAHCRNVCHFEQIKC